MLIKTLRLENFRQFKGTTEVNFSRDTNRNVTIILGNNTYGKTTLLQAFNWCLYGKANFDGDNVLLNRELALDMQNGAQETVEVEVVLVRAEDEYIITRKQEYNCSGGKVHGRALPTVEVSIKGADGQTKPVKRNQKISELINNLLPESLSKYFFFDTERISNVGTDKNIAGAVKNFVGLSVLENAHRHLGNRAAKTTVVGKFYAAMDLDGDARARDASNKMQSAEEARKKNDEALDMCNNQIDLCEARKAEVEQILRNNQSTSVLQKEKDILERQILRDEKNLKKATERYFSYFSANALRFFIQPLPGMAENFLESADITDKGVRDVTRATIEELIRRGRCICGQEICMGNEAYRHLMAEIAYVSPESIGVTVRHYREKLKSFSHSHKEIFADIGRLYEEITELKHQIEENEDDLDNRRKEISGKEDMKPYEKELDDIRRRLSKLNDQRDSLNQKSDSLKRDIEYFQKIYDSLMATSAKNREAKEFLTYAEEIKEWLEKSLKNKEQQLRESLLEELSKIFKKMYHGQRKIELDEKYQTKLYAVINGHEEELTLSEGLKRVRNFSFIAGLVALAKKKIFKDLEIPSEAYPLVMDAPFSNTDEEHTANISEVLPQIAEQVIMFVMQKDWANAEPVMSQRVGKKYRLNKISETFTKIEEV